MKTTRKPTNETRAKAARKALEKFLPLLVELEEAFDQPAGFLTEMALRTAVRSPFCDGYSSRRTFDEPARHHTKKASRKAIDDLAGELATELGCFVPDERNHYTPTLLEVEGKLKPILHRHREVLAA